MRSGKAEIYASTIRGLLLVHLDKVNKSMLVSCDQLFSFAIPFTKIRTQNDHKGDRQKSITFKNYHPSIGSWSAVLRSALINRFARGHRFMKRSHQSLGSWSPLYEALSSIARLMVTALSSALINRFASANGFQPGGLGATTRWQRQRHYSVTAPAATWWQRQRPEQEDSP